MKKTENQIKKLMNPILDVDLNLEKLTKRIDFHEERKETNFMNKKVFIPLSLLTIAGCAVAVISLGLVKPNVTAQPKALVSVDVNPTIDLVVDENDVVISVTGTNEEGKMIVADEEIEGKNIKDALEIIIKVESETGYLVEGNVSANENEIKISVSADTDAIKDALENTITSTVDEVCNQLNIKAETIVSEVEKYSREVLEQKALEYDPTLTEEQVKEMTYEQLLNVINLHYLETAEIWSMELENLYTEAKENKIQITENEFVKSAINGANKIYQMFLDMYTSACDSIEDAINSLEEERYNLLVAEDSDYQLKLKEFNEAKAELLKLKNEVASSETPDEDVINLLSLKESAVNALISSLEGLGSLANKSIDNAKNSLTTILDSLKSIQESFPEEITSILEEKAGELETSINETKDNFFDAFEDKYQEDINRIKEDVTNRKQTLKDNIAGENA